MLLVQKNKDNHLLKIIFIHRPDSLLAQAMSESICLPSLVLANAVRRTILNDLQGYAADEATFFKNTSLQTEEMIAFSLAWAPLRWSSTGKAASLSVHNSADEKFFRTVRCRDLIGPDLEFVDPMAPIAKLAPGEELMVDVTFKAGSGREHSKFCRAVRVGCMPTKDGCTLTAWMVDPQDSVIPDALKRISSGLCSYHATRRDTDHTFEFPNDTLAILMQHYVTERLGSNMSVVSWFDKSLKVECDNPTDLHRASAIVGQVAETVSRLIASFETN
jgi:hypothetical protein